MGRQSGVPHTEEQMEALSDEDLDAEVWRVKSRLGHAPSSMLQKAFEKRLHSLEKIQGRRAT